MLVTDRHLLSIQSEISKIEAEISHENELSACDETGHLSEVQF